MAQFEAKEYEAAEKAFSALNGYLDSVEWAEKAKNARLEEAYNAARKAYQKGAYEDAMAQFKALGNFRDSAEQVKNCAAAIERKKNQQASSSTSGSKPSSTQTNTPVDPLDKMLADLQGVWEATDSGVNYYGQSFYHKYEMRIEGNYFWEADYYKVDGKIVDISYSTGPFVLMDDGDIWFERKGASFKDIELWNGVYRDRSATAPQYGRRRLTGDPATNRVSIAAVDYTRCATNDTPIYDFCVQEYERLKPLCQ